MISGKTLLAAAAVILLGSIGISNAQTTEPATQGLDSVEKNLAKDKDGDSDSHGLLNAKQRIERNQARQELREKADNDVARPDRPERPERPERGRS